MVPSLTDRLSFNGFGIETGSETDVGVDTEVFTTARALLGVLFLLLLRPKKRVRADFFGVPSILVSEIPFRGCGNGLLLRVIFFRITKM